MRSLQWLKQSTPDTPHTAVTDTFDQEENKGTAGTVNKPIMKCPLLFKGNMVIIIFWCLKHSSSGTEYWEKIHMSTACAVLLTRCCQTCSLLLAEISVVLLITFGVEWRSRLIQFFSEGFGLPSYAGRVAVITIHF